jgi:xanthosine utilization system XapX-like protein
VVSLLGMLIGEQVPPPIKRAMAGEPVTTAWFRSERVPKFTGNPPNVGIAAGSECNTKAGSQ